MKRRKTVKDIISEYMSKIGSKGGAKSKRKLTREQSLAMLQKRKDRIKKK